MSFVLFSLLVAYVSCAITECPANTCGAGETCCSTSSEGATPQDWGCCPYDKASCCGDLSHCCPNGWNCDITKGQCIQSNKRVTFSFVKLNDPEPQACPMGTCPSSETCCALTGGQFGCCPYAKADCCTDHAHCCPNGYACDISKGTCTKGASASSVASHSVPLVAVVGPEAVCPAGTCPNTETCCALTDGQYGCCPFANAVCCTDHAHCCPNGYTCDVTKGQCTKGVSASAVASHSLPLFAVVAPQATCPNGTCPSSETCCAAGGNQWGCCPYKNADCCTDDKHCCPNGYTCNLKMGECMKGSSGSAYVSLPLVEVVAPKAVCPNNTCSASETCCAAGGGKWGCCYYSDAVCCSDDVHCCPRAYQCNLSTGQCVPASGKSLLSHRVMHLVEVALPNTTCPAGTCPSTETCCAAGGNQWGCCPYNNADCCSDDKHCCPHGYTCNLKMGECVKGGGSAYVSLPLVEVVAPQACPMGTCSSGETCCALTGGQFGCCPYAKADCCTDHAHCCPNGYACDISKGTCTKGASASSVASHSIPLVAVVAPAAACPSGTCSSTETCCSLSTGGWGCCPYAKADCCTDHAHCCPNGYTCNTSKGQCVHAGNSEVVFPLTKL